MPGCRFIRALVLATLMMAIPCLAGPPPAAQNIDDNSDTRLQANIPLGIQGFFVRPARRNLYVMSTVNSPTFEGWREVRQDGRTTVYAEDGSRVQYFPRTLHFRVTATAMLDLIAVDRDLLDVDMSLNDLLLGLRFRLKVFRGLDVTRIMPDSIETLGLPGNIKSDERIYRANFVLPQVSIEDRLVLEVLTPGGERMCRFHLAF